MSAKEHTKVTKVAPKTVYASGKKGVAAAEKVKTEKSELPVGSDEDKKKKKPETGGESSAASSNAELDVYVTGIPPAAIVSDVKAALE